MGKAKTKSNWIFRLISIFSFLSVGLSLHGGVTQSKEVKLNETFWLSSTPHNGTVGVTWTWDEEHFEIVNNSMSQYGQVQFKAIKGTSNSVAYIQAKTRYQSSGAPGSYTDYDDWRIVVIDNSTVELPSALSLYEGERFDITATVSASEYVGSFKWESSRTDIITVYGNSNTANLYAKKKGNATIKVYLDNGASASCTVTVKPKGDIPNTSEYEIVDLGLSVNWAQKNLGAKSETDYGLRFAWGETKTKSNFTTSNSETYYIDMFRPNSYVDANYILKPEHDAAHCLMGEKWRMPTCYEFKELINRCKIELKNDNGQYYYEVTGPSGKSIIFPFDHDAWRGTCYWTSETGSNIYEANLCMIRSNSPNFSVASSDRCEGYYIRGVTKEPDSSNGIIGITESDSQISGANGMIILKGCINQKICIYSACGCLIFNDLCTEEYVNVPSGIYIVIVEGHYSKILVK